MYETRGVYASQPERRFMSAAADEVARPGFCARLNIAHLLSGHDAESSAHYFERAGRRLTLDDFRSDYRALLDPDKMAVKGIVPALEFVRLLEPKEFDDLIKPLPDYVITPLRDLVEQLRINGAKPVAEILPEVLEQLWQDHWQSDLDRYCKRNASELRLARKILNWPSESPKSTNDSQKPAATVEKPTPINSPGGLDLEHRFEAQPFDEKPKKEETNLEVK